MDFFEVVHTRRSVRKYLSEPVSSDDLDKILRAAMAAPTAANAKEWHFIVEKDRAVLNKIAENHAHAQMVKEAPLAILVCADISSEKPAKFWEQDCAAATQNILLAARALNIGSVWCGVAPIIEREEPLKKLYNLPSHIRVLSLIVLGHCELDAFKTKDNFIPSQIHYGKFN